MAQIKRFGVLQTAKFSAALYFVFSAVLILPLMLITTLVGAASGQSGAPAAMFSGIFLIVMPFVYGILGFIFVAIGCLIYNLIASLIGGIEIELE